MSRELWAVEKCGHEGALNPATSTPIDGMRRHALGVVTGYNRGGAETFESKKVVFGE